MSRSRSRSPRDAPQREGRVGNGSADNVPEGWASDWEAWEDGLYQEAQVRHQAQVQARADHRATAARRPSRDSRSPPRRRILPPLGPRAGGSGRVSDRSSVSTRSSGHVIIHRRSNWRRRHNIEHWSDDASDPEGLADAPLQAAAPEDPEVRDAAPLEAPSSMPEQEDVAPNIWSSDEETNPPLAVRLFEEPFGTLHNQLQALAVDEQGNSLIYGQPTIVDLIVRGGRGSGHEISTRWMKQHVHFPCYPDLAAFNMIVPEGFSEEHYFNALIHDENGVTLPSISYHGTRVPNLQGILRRGLKKGPRQISQFSNDRAGVWHAEDPRTAEFYAYPERWGRIDRAQVILEIETVRRGKKRETYAPTRQFVSSEGHLRVKAVLLREYDAGSIYCHSLRSFFPADRGPGGGLVPYQDGQAPIRVALG